MKAVVNLSFPVHFTLTLDFFPLDLPWEVFLPLKWQEDPLEHFGKTHHLLGFLGHAVFAYGLHNRHNRNSGQRPGTTVFLD